MEERKKRIESGLIAAERGLSEHKEAQQKAVGRQRNLELIVTNCYII
jgi:F0F1-type ATP synthase membrane subunit b/b'